MKADSVQSECTHLKSQSPIPQVPYMKTTTTSTLCKLLVCSGIISQSAYSSTVVSFLTSQWTSGAIGQTPTTQTGYREATPGTGNIGSSGFTTVSDGSQSVTVTFTGTFVGSSTRASSGNNNNGSFENAIRNPEGFIFGSFDDNTTTLTVSDDQGTISGTIQNYQRWDIVFSTPVILNSFRLLDIDSSGGDNPNTFRDIVAVERFVGTSVGTAGTGIDGILTPVSANSLLFQSTGASFGTESINSIIAPLNLGNPSSTDPVNVNVSFGDEPIQAISLYTFSDRPQVHRLSLEGSGFEITIVPEPSSALLVSLAGLCLLRRRRR